MKRFFYAVMFLLCMSIMVSCEKEEESSKTISKGDLVGSWVPTDDSEISFYWEFTSDGYIKYYQLEAPDYIDYDDYQYCSFNNGTLYVPQSYSWDLTMYGEYDLVDNIIFFSGLNMGTITKVNKDKYLFNSSLLVDGTVQRIKKMSTK